MSRGSHNIQYPLYVPLEIDLVSGMALNLWTLHARCTVLTQFVPMLVRCCQNRMTGCPRSRPVPLVPHFTPPSSTAAIAPPSRPGNVQPNSLDLSLLQRRRIPKDQFASSAAMLPCRVRSSTSLLLSHDFTKLWTSTKKRVRMSTLPDYFEFTFTFDI